MGQKPSPWGRFCYPGAQSKAELRLSAPKKHCVRGFIDVTRLIETSASPRIGTTLELKTFPMGKVLGPSLVRTSTEELAGRHF